jgi:hypothetical protein
MSAVAIAATVVSVCAVLALVILAVGMRNLLRQTTALVETVTRERLTHTAATDAGSASAPTHSTAPLRSVATPSARVATTVDLASRVARLPVRRPGSRAVVFASGAAAAGRSFRQRRRHDQLRPGWGR